MSYKNFWKQKTNKNSWKPTPKKLYGLIKIKFKWQQSSHLKQCRTQGCVPTCMSWRKKKLSSANSMSSKNNIKKERRNKGILMWRKTDTICVLPKLLLKSWKVSPLNRNQMISENCLELQKEKNKRMGKCK